MTTLGVIVRQFLWVIAAILLITGASGVGAAERRQLSAESFSQALASQPVSVAAFSQLRRKAARAGKVRVMVWLRVPFAAEGQLAAPETTRQRSEIAGTRTRLMKSLPNAASGRVRSFTSLPFVAMDVTEGELTKLAANPAVQTIVEDRLNRPTLAQSVPLIRGDAAWTAGYRGLGQTIAIIDTGVDKAHPFMFGKVVSEACYSTGGWCPGGQKSSTAEGSGRPCPARDCTHGTHVAGIAAGIGPKYSGVAKDANLIAIQVFSPVGRQARAYDSDIIAGLERVYALSATYRIAAVNMSLGGDGFTESCDGENPFMTAIITQLRQAGIATVIASGNDGMTDAISSPACISTAVSVGAVSDGTSAYCRRLAALDKVACYSNSASMLSLLAPGSMITSSIPNRKYAAYEGTSMAAPHVAGAWAVLREKDPGADVTTLLAALKSTGKPVTDYRNGLTVPRIDVKSALDTLTDPRKAIAYARSGPVQGTVDFSPAGTVASCHQDCFNRFATGTRVNLTARPDPGAQFYGWGGDCSGTGNCVVDMTAARSVYAGFYTGRLLNLNLARSGAGGGTVAFNAAGFTAQCAGNCTQSYWKNATVWLTAVPAAGSYFKGWSGACRGKKDYCAVRLSSAKSVTASFETLPSYTLSYRQQGFGGGSLAFSNGNTPSCSGSCSRTFLAGTELSLTAMPDLTSEFAGWSGTCKGPKSTCVLTVRGPIDITATFRSSSAASASR